MLTQGLTVMFIQGNMRAKKKKIRGRLTVDQGKTRARTRVSVILVDHFGGKTSGNRVTTRFVFSAQTLMWQGKRTFYMKASFC